MNGLDIETYVENDKIIPFCIVYHVKKKFFCEYGNDCIKSFFDNIFRFSFKKEIIFIHNLNFDGFLLIEFLSKNKLYIFEVFMRELNIYSITVTYDSKTIVFKCSYKILPLPLSKIADIFDIGEKMIYPYKFVTKDRLNYIGEVPPKNNFNTELEYNLFKNSNLVYDLKNYTIKYCKNDVFITIEFMKNIFKILNQFSINIVSIYSAPSLAFKIFIKNFNNNRIKIKYNNIIDKFSRKSYYGGRCEVYGNPKKDEHIFHFDFTGMYAQCMLEKFPFGRYEIKSDIKKIQKPGIYWIEYESENMDYPILPHHRIQDGKLMFTNGNNIGAYWFEEILLFLEHGGRIKRILYALTFENYDYVFNEYVEFFSDLRKKSKSLNIFGKLMINSIYGRMGMKNIDTYTFVEKIEKIPNLRNNKIDILNIRELNQIAIIEAELNSRLEKYFNIKNKKSKNNIVIASAITSKARIKLYNAQQSVIKNKGRVLYSDTDSIFASYKRNVLNEKHGEIFWDEKKEDTQISEAIFFSAKSYALRFPNGKESIKIKGYNQKNISFSEIKEYFLKKEKINLKNYKFLNKKNLELYYIQTEKIFDLNFYDKRYFINPYETKAYYYDKKNMIYRKE